MHSTVLLLSTLVGSAFALPGIFPRGFNTTTVPGGKPGSTITTTITDTITKTTFKPCSTPVHTEGGTTYYSSWVTASTYETTTCYTTTQVLASPPTEAPTVPAQTTTTNAGAAPTHAGGSDTCPEASTVTVYVTVGSGTAPTNAPGGPCNHCETITYTNTQGHTTTIVIPPVSQTTGGTSTETSKPTGTGSQPTKPTGTGNAPAPTETKVWHGPRDIVRN
ncbi:hypothetical protein BDV28DRAFT_145583 [Aspergillus coremiiformis]|uniref:Extracellular proline-rich protein n=1 Tax=Aspergillus coremiiformis TaxID=138285 RepID=A0A5N6ZEJ4_9EURO|nr:hypothetical protein BDV28DRAFT_145583 [Aspergillus coremiiformis]